MTLYGYMMLYAHHTSSYHMFRPTNFHQDPLRPPYHSRRISEAFGGGFGRTLRAPGCEPRGEGSG